MNYFIKNLPRILEPIFEHCTPKILQSREDRKQQNANKTKEK